jgi:predicted cupin superfamily sugar epimerase
MCVAIDDIERLRGELELAPHPEGGYYRELYRSPLSVIDRRGRTRCALTVIHFLLPSDQVSAWHVLASDETWHFASGDSIEVAMLDDGRFEVVTLGAESGYVLVVPAGRPFAARVKASETFGLVTCCVAPGFEFEDFELLDPAALARDHPAHAAAIQAFVRIGVPRETDGRAGGARR